MLSLIHEVRVWRDSDTEQNRDRRTSLFQKAENLHKKSRDIDATILPHGNLDSKQMRMLKRSVALKHGAAKLNQQGLSQLKRIPKEGRLKSRVDYSDRPFLGRKKK